MMRKYIFILFVGVLVLVLVLSTRKNLKKVVFVCDEKRTIGATFDLKKDVMVILKLSDGRFLELPHAISASGARYANKDESIVFWNKGNTAFMTEKDKMTYSNCVEGSAKKVAVTPAVVVTKEVHSGDGVMNLVMTMQKQSDGLTKYTFRVIKRQDGSAIELFSRQLAPGATMDMPENSWSPDNKQFFVIEKQPDTTRYYVYRADGSTYKTGVDFLEIYESWLKTKNKYILSGVTGWEGNDLLRVTTNKDDGTKGPSFWFVISSRGFIQLRSIN